MSIVTEIRNEIDRCRTEQREKDVAKKKNPCLEELREIIADMKVSVPKKQFHIEELEKLASEMDKSPLILKVKPEVLRAIDDDYYKHNVNHTIAYNEREIGFDAVTRGLDLLEILQDILSVTLHPDESFTEAPMLEKVKEAMYWLLFYIREAQAFDSLEPEEAALACLAKNEASPFTGFDEKLSEAREEDRLEKED